MKKIILISVIVIFALAVLGFVKDQIIKQAIIGIGSHVIGTKLEIKSFSLDLVNQSVRVNGLKIYNPKGFPKGVIIDLPKAYAKLGMDSLFSAKIHIVSAEIQIKEMGLVKNKEGKLNVDSLKLAQKDSQVKEESGRKMPLEIDLLRLNIGRVVLKDYTGGGEPAISVYDININKVYKNIKSVDQLAALIISEPMKAAGITGVAIYGVSALAGVAILPVSAGAVLIGKDSAEEDFVSGYDIVYKVSKDIINKSGRLISEDKGSGVIKADIRGASVNLEINKINRKTKVTISVRKFMLPKPEIAAGILYQIKEKIK